MGNPKILEKDGTGHLEEGCLSIPHTLVNVERAAGIWVQALDIDNRPVEIKIDGLTARAVQHEIDHLDGELWMEVFLVWGTNTTPGDVKKIAELVKTLSPDKVQLNTSVRPPCEEFAHAVPEDQMADLARLFEPEAEVIAEYSSDTSAELRASAEDILRMLERRPCTLEQICRVFGLHRNEASKYVGKLVRTGSAREYRKDGDVYYFGIHLEEAVHAHL